MWFIADARLGRDQSASLLRPWRQAGRRSGPLLLGVYLIAVLAVEACAVVPSVSGCVGDCNASQDVTVDEIVTLVNIALGSGGITLCQAGDADHDGSITIDEIILAVHNAVSACPPSGTPTPSPTPESPCSGNNPLRNVYFGDLHVHTTYSFDAHMFDVRTTPEQAYRFARGESVALPPLDADGNGTRIVRLDRPLDFTAVTDHSEFLGEVEVCSTPGSATYDSQTCQDFRAGSYDGVRKFGLALTGSKPRRFADVCGTDNQLCPDAAGEVWRRIQDAAAAAYDPCRFTTFVAYEFSAAPGASTMHRNVIFRNATVPFPTSSFEQAKAQGLWDELKHTCVDAGTGCDVLAIPHNPNESNGKMFRVEYPGATTPDEQRQQAAFRAAMEPLVEIYQHKGNSECRNGLSGVFGAPDEQCEFEKRRPDPIEDCGDDTGQTGTAGQGCVSRLDYVRGALLAGLLERQRLGANPYQLGFIGSTDTHNGTPGNTEEQTFLGHRGSDDGTPEQLLGHGILTDGGVIFSPGALAAAWAEENSRESLFAAMRRRETFATSGTRISVRFFGGWSYPAGLCDQSNLIQIGYAAGTPMGGVLPVQPGGTVAPTFVLSALSDPGLADRPGTPLQRLQIVKGWIEGADAHEQVYDVAGDAQNGASVDLTTCVPRGFGASSLCTVWTDPAFDPTRQAFYYARVLENPSCRWNTYLCNRLPLDQRQPACDDPSVPKTVQERAWTSPIWYEPRP